MLISYDWIHDYFSERLPEPETLERLLSLHAFEIEGIEKVGDDHIIDVDVLPNRSSDCLSHRGVARELATIFDCSLAHDPLTAETVLPQVDSVRILRSDEESCRKFGVAALQDLTVTESPDWLKKRLIAIGQRPINNIVDVTNYVMCALGQPMHAYDADKLKTENGAHVLGVRAAQGGEQITVLTGETYTLESGMQIIVDSISDVPIGIAGIKGGAHAEIDADTTRILLEAANFDPIGTRKTSHRLRLQTDASKRFENEPSPKLIEYALRAAVELLLDIAGGTCEGYAIDSAAIRENPLVPVDYARVNALLGLSLEKAEVESIFERLGFYYEPTGTGWSVRAPFERTDIRIEEEVVEEVGRIHGYTHIPSVVPETVSLTEINSRQFYSEKIRVVLSDIGFSEVITSSFRKKDKVKLLNALASDKQYLRSSLRKNIEDALTLNMPNRDLLGLDTVRVFEIGAIFYKDKTGAVIEQVSVGLGVRTKQTGYTPHDDTFIAQAFTKLEAALETPIDRTIERGVGTFNLTTLLETLPAPDAYAAHEVSAEIQYRPFSPYPFISRDIALWVPAGTSPEEVESVINGAAGDLRVRTTLFDEFEKEGRISYAFRIIFQSEEKTLTDREIEPVMTAIRGAVEACRWEVR